MWAQVLRVILTHPIPFIASSAVLVTLGDKVDLARITTPPAQPASPSLIVSSPSLSSGRPFAEREDFWSNAIPQDFDSLEWFDLAAPTPSRCDFDDYQQEQDPSSDVLYSWPEAFPVEDEPSNEDSNALQGQGQSEFNGEFEDSTITLPSIVTPSTTSGVTRAGYFSFISYVGECFFGDGDLDQSKPESESDAASSSEDPSQSPVAPVSDDFYYGRTPSLNYLLKGVFAYLGFLLCLWIISIPIKYGRKPKPCCYISFDQLLAEVKPTLSRSSTEALIESNRAADEARVKAHKDELDAKDAACDKRNEVSGETIEKAYQALIKSDEETGAHKKRIKALEEENLTLKEENEILMENLKEIFGGARSTSRQELDEGNEDMDKLKEELASARAENKELSTRLGRESGNSTELRRLLDLAKAHAEPLKGSLVKKEQEVREAHEAKLQAITEASEARKEAEASRATSKAAQLELEAVQLQLAKFKADVEASRNETSIAIAREEAVILRIAYLEKVLAESEEKTASVQKKADTTITSLESRLDGLGRALAESEANRENVQKEANATLANRESQLNTTIASLESRLDDLGRALAESEEKGETVQMEADATLANRESQLNATIASLESRLDDLGRALAESEETRETVQMEADATIANLELQLDAEKVNKENLARDYERALALRTEAKLEATPPSFEVSENSSVPVQPSEEAAVPTPVAEPQSSLAEDGLVPSSASAPPSNPSGQSWREPLGFTMALPSKKSFPKSEPGLFGIPYGSESTGLPQQKFDAVASCGGTDNSKSDSMEVSDSTPSTTSSGSTFGAGPATLSTPVNASDLVPTATPIEGSAAISQEPDAPTPTAAQIWAGNLMAFLTAGVADPPQDPGFDGATSFVGQDLNAVASQDMGALSSYGGGYNSGLNSMNMEFSTTSSMANTFDYNAPAANPPMAVDATFGATTNTYTNTAFGDPAPIGQQSAHDPHSMAAYNSQMAMAGAGPLPPPSQDPTSTGVSMMNQQWEASQPPNPGFGVSLGQEQSYDPNAGPQTPMDQNAQQPLWYGQPAPQQDQNLHWQQGFEGYSNVPPYPNNSFGSSQTFNFQFNPQSVPQQSNIAVQPNPPAIYPTSGPLTQSGPGTISPLVFYNPARDTRYFTGNSPFAMVPAPSYASALPPTSYSSLAGAMGPGPSDVSAPPPTSSNSLAAPPSLPPVNQIPETTPIDPSQTGNWSGQYSAPVVENTYDQPTYNGPAGDDEVSLGENDGDEDWRQYHASLSGSRESAPSPEFESREPGGQDPLEGDWAKFEDDLDSYSDQGTGDVIIPISPPQNHVSEGLASAADTPRPIKRLPRSLRRTQVNEAGQFPNETPVAAQVAADEGDGSGAWGATVDDQDPPTPPPTASGERAIRALPKSRRRQATSQMSVGN